jgi:hypothetical protein
MGTKKQPTKEIAMHYVRYVQAKYGYTCIIFDGCNQGPSIKDHEHQRRVTRRVQILSFQNQWMLVSISRLFFPMSGIKANLSYC